MVGKSDGYFYRIGREMEVFFDQIFPNATMDSLPRPDQDYSCYKALEKDTLAAISPSHGMQSFQKAKDARLLRRGHTPLKCVVRCFFHSFNSNFHRRPLV
ncbi:hypothetical protein NC651_010964 [Populus alba x Populus x berolinensis]|nr:hypothetical protein NC651_010964 [Populus alba x Populus x berolinensis]